MPRDRRQKSESGFYHVVLKGDGNMDLFDNDKDRGKFLHKLDDVIRLFKVEIIAWCLMSNHIHLLLDDPDDELSDCIHRIATSYAVYYNDTIHRKGSVFQDRFFSAPVESDEQLVTCTFYIHDNPLNGMGIHPARYQWCSYHEYISVPERTRTDLILDMLGGIDQFIAASEDRRRKTYYMVEGKTIPDDDIANAARAVLGNIEPASVGKLAKDVRAPLIKKLRDIGLSVRQIERITGAGKKMIVRDCAT